MLDRTYDAALADAYNVTLGALGGGAAGGHADFEQGLEIARQAISQSPAFAALPELSPDEAEQAARSVADDLFLLGPIEPLLADPEVTEIMVNGPDDVYIEQRGKISKSEVRFRDDEHIMRVIQRIAADDNRRCDTASPLCDCTLHRPSAPFDGSRVNATSKPISVDHPTLDIRKFRTDKLTMASLMEGGTLDERQAEIIESLVRARMNIIIMGGTGSGKTTLLNAVSNYIPDDQRIITVEDTAELKLAKSHVLRMEARQANLEGRGAITIRQIIKNTLRQRPDRIVVGEVRGGEAFDLLQAMGTGHDGSLTTLHANNSRAALTRLQMLVQMSDEGANMPPAAIMRIITDAVDFVVNVRRYQDGTRKVAEIAEVQGMQGDVPTLSIISQFVQEGYEGKRVVGSFQPTGDRFCQDHKERFANNGVDIDEGWFDRWA